jgi:hypothetical protein
MFRNEKKCKVVLPNGESTYLTKQQLRGFWLALEIPFGRALNKEEIRLKYNITITYV